MRSSAAPPLTEEFHPGFRNSVAAYTVSLLNPTVIADLELARARPADRRAAGRQFLAGGRAPLSADALRPRQPAGARLPRSRPRDAERLPAYDAALGAGRRAAARAGAEAAAQRRRRHPGAARQRRPRPPAVRADARGQAPAARPLHQERRRFPGHWFESEVVKGALRLRRHRRRLCQPAHARHGLRAAAPLLRRGERQVGRLGPRRSAAWARSRRPWRARPRRAARRIRTRRAGRRA